MSKIKVVNDRGFIIRWRESEGEFRHYASTATKLVVGDRFLSVINPFSTKSPARILQKVSKIIEDHDIAYDHWVNAAFRVKSLKERI